MRHARGDGSQGSDGSEGARPDCGRGLAMRSLPAILQLVLLAFGGVALRAADDQGGSFAWIAPTIQPQLLTARVALDEEVPVAVSGQAAEYTKLTLRSSLQAQLYHDHHQELLLTASLVDAKVDSSATFTGSGLEIPERLFDIRLGGLYRTIRPDGSIDGVQASIGNASPVDLNSNNLTFSASLFSRQPSTGNNAWLYFLAYSDERAVLNYVPFPGFAYLWNPNPHWHTVAGLPILAVTWAPNDRLKADALLSGFGNAHLGVNEQPLSRCRPLHLKLSCDWGGDVFRRADYPDHNDHIIFRSIRTSAGASLLVGKNRSLDVYGGYATDRQVIEGRDLFSHGNHIDLHSGVVFGGSGTWSF